MSAEGHIAVPPAKGRVLLLTLIALIVASTIVVLFVLPAEFHRDPTGFGRLTGIDQLAGPEVITAAALPAESGSAARYYDTPYRSDVFDIKLAPEGKGGDLEYKVRMKSGATITYSFNVTGDEEHPEWFYFDFHSESVAKEGEKPIVVEFLQTTGIKSAGSLISPFDGIYGWYLQNQSDKPVVVHLKVSGFYELIPKGEYGNEAGIEPLPPGNAK